MMSTLQQILIF